MREYLTSISIDYPALISSYYDASLYSKGLELLDLMEYHRCVSLEDLAVGEFQIYYGFDDRKNVCDIAIVHQDYISDEIFVVREKIKDKPEAVVFSNAFCNRDDISKLLDKMGDDTIRAIADTFIANDEEKIVVKNVFKDNVFVDVCYGTDFEEIIGAIIRFDVEERMCKKIIDIFHYTQESSIEELYAFAGTKIKRRPDIPCPYLETNDGNFLIREGDTLVKIQDDYLLLPSNHAKK